MKTIHIYRLDHLSPALFEHLREVQMEAAQVWNLCVSLHKEARMSHTRWPGRNELQQATKGRYALHSQSVQMIVHAFLANIETTRKLRREHPEMRMKYPWREKRFYPVHWPAQAVALEKGRVILPMGRGRPSIVLPIALPDNAGACTLVWNYGFELHVCVETEQAAQAPGAVQATVDLGEIHLAAVSTNAGKALIVTGRGIRSLKRGRAKQIGQITRKQSRCSKHSRRWKKLQRAKNKVCRREYGKDIDYLTHKSTQARISCFTGSERGTSSRCPRCGHKHKPKGRTWVCRKCGFRGHRDLVGSVNMHQDAFGVHLKFPRSFTYLRPGLLKTGKRSSRADTPLVSQETCCLEQPTAQPRIADTVSPEIGSPVRVVQKPIPF